MSLILKGIDKSKYARTFRIYPSGVAMEIKDGKIDNENPYEAIQIPKRHGRLIDADELVKQLRKDPLFDLVERYGISGVIESRPTILEAEE